MSLKFLGDRNNMYVYPWYISDIATTKDIVQTTNGLKVEKTFIVIENDFWHFYCDDESMGKIGKYYFEKVLEDEKFLTVVINNIYKYSEHLEKFCEKVNLANISAMENGELLDIYGEYIEKLRTLRAWGWVPVLLDGADESFLTDYIQKELRDHLRKINQDEKFSAYYSTLTSSHKLSEVQTEELARLDLLLTISNDKNWKKISTLIMENNVESIGLYKDVDQALKKHLKDYGWLTYAYSGPAMDMEYLMKLLRDNIEKGDMREQKEKILKHYKDIEKEKGQLISKLNMSNELAHLCKASSELMFIKDYRKGIYQKSYLAMDKVLGEIAKRLSFSLKEIKYMVFDEVQNALVNEVDYRDVIRERFDKCCFVTEDGKIEIYQGEEAESVIKDNVEAVTESHEEVEDLKGMIAYSGKVQGIVKIVLVEDDVSKVDEGDILVSSSTNPDLILAMKKAAAFVTDTGGITSHAAIVSRELKKPCIVGTKIATHALKDGDVVEVDAEQGIVTILKKA